MGLIDALQGAGQGQCGMVAAALGLDHAHFRDGAFGRPRRKQFRVGGAHPERTDEPQREQDDHHRGGDACAADHLAAAAVVAGAVQMKFR